MDNVEHTKIKELTPGIQNNREKASIPGLDKKASELMNEMLFYRVQQK